MRVFLSSNYENLAAENCDATVEAEFGDTCIEGKFLTMAHHGSRSGNPAPCSYENIGMRDDTTIGISHVDLDTVGGIMAIKGIKPDADSFWDLAAFVDVNGAHKLGEAGATSQDVRAIRAYWAFSDTFKVYAPHDGAVEDVTSKIDAHACAIMEILAGDVVRLAVGDKWHAEMEALPTTSLVSYDGGVIMRQSPRFVNHLYEVNGMKQLAVVAMCSKTCSITVSFANEGFDACALVQKLWGPLAGGHKGIAGSPRGQAMTNEDADNAFRAVKDAVSLTWAQQHSVHGGFLK